MLPNIIINALNGIYLIVCNIIMFHVIFLNDDDISSKTLHMNRINLKNYVHL